jgi:antitoxin component HigA of HigAB toxin-antitoxin module
MKKFTEYELEKFRALDREIKDEVHHEQALRAVRRMRPRIRLNDDEPKEEVPADVAALRQSLFNRVAAYERKEYPYGQPNFEEWSASRTDEDYRKKTDEVERAEQLVDQLEAFEVRRAARIKERLKQRALKQQDLAVILHSDKTYVSHLLAGRKPFTIEVVSRIHDSLGVPYEDLIPPAAAFGIPRN